LPPVDETELKRIRAALGQLDITAAQKVLEAAAQAEAKIAELTARIETLEKEAAELATKAEDLRTLLNPQIALDHAEAVAQYEQARADYTTAKEERATAAAKLEAAEKQLAGIAKQKLELEELRTSLASMEAEAAEWRYLSEATGPDGIQALELDALGPGIAETANRLLSAAYGSRFSIEFRTTRLAGKGSKTKSVEDFAIYVIDNELLTEQPIETLSGGEAVWIKQALYSSFAIIRDRSTGIRFLTAFKDECDGALDPESRAKYFQLLQAEHAESGRRHTLIITHSESAQEMIPQKIEMRRAS
jgi:exonuclease SbcC